MSQLFGDFQSAYNQRDMAKYSGLIDDRFVFYLSFTDASTGHPSQWNKSQELEYTGELFDPDYAGTFRCDSIYFQLYYPNPHAIELYTFHPDSAPDETWYSTILGYDYFFRFGSINFALASGPGNKIKFTIRNAGTERAPVWKFVQIRDYGSDGIPSQASAEEVMIWTLGRAKSLYVPPARTAR